MPSSFSLFEIIMLLCFACSWPLSIYKALKTKFVLGKSPAFMMIIILGYIFGIIHKIVYQPDMVTFLWGFNMLLVTIDLILYFYFAPRNKKESFLNDKRHHIKRENRHELNHTGFPQP